jgi:hypothetical protein
MHLLSPQPRALEQVGRWHSAGRVSTCGALGGCTGQAMRRGLPAGVLPVSSSLPTCMNETAKPASRFSVLHF